jgi:hypothetical protein
MTWTPALNRFRRGGCASPRQRKISLDELGEAFIKSWLRVGHDLLRLHSEPDLWRHGMFVSSWSPQHIRGSSEASGFPRTRTENKKKRRQSDQKLGRDI